MRPAAVCSHSLSHRGGAAMTSTRSASYKTDIWAFFSQIESDPKYALCLQCNKKLEKGVELTATMKTPNLKHHLKTVHPEIFSKLEKSSKFTKSFRTLKSARGESLLLNPGTYKKYSKYKLSEKQGSHSPEEDLTCRRCEAALQGRTYVVKNEFSYCTPCFEQLFAETCQSHSYQDSHWHEDCFTCSLCGVCLAGRDWRRRGPGLVCGDCEQECGGCHNPLLAGDEKVGCGERAWHPACFTCHHCHAPLLSASFTVRELHPFCLRCLDKLFARTCQACPEPIIPGSGRYISLNGKFWHKTCFTCSYCRENLAEQGFSACGDMMACTSCFIELHQD